MIEHLDELSRFELEERIKNLYSDIVKITKANKMLSDFARKVRDDSPHAWGKRAAERVIIEAQITTIY